jgi:hypothetical protein
MERKKITFYKHPNDPHTDQILMGLEWTPLQILQYFESYKTWHTKAFGETEAQILTKGKKIYFGTRTGNTFD